MVAIGGNPDAPVREYGVRDYVEYYQAILLPKAARTFGAAVASVALLLGGWLTTVQAASRSLPGDPLYGIKIITEQAQLRIASLEERAILHTEFAERRLQEAVVLEASGNDATALEAITAFRAEVASANTTLQELQTTKNGAAATTASAVEERLGALDSVLDQTVAVASAEVSTEAQAAKDASREVQSTAVSVVVDDHEEEGGEQSQREISAMFLREYGDVQARQEFDMHRVQVVRTAMQSNAAKLEGVTLPTDADLDVMEKAITGVGERIGDAMDNFALGGYRTAFELLRSLDGELLLMESRLAQAEVAITTALAAPVVREEEPAIIIEEGSETSEPVPSS